MHINAAMDTCFARAHSGQASYRGQREAPGQCGETARPNGQVDEALEQVFFRHQEQGDGADETQHRQERNQADTHARCRQLTE